MNVTAMQQSLINLLAGCTTGATTDNLAHQLGKRVEQVSASLTGLAGKTKRLTHKRLPHAGAKYVTWYWDAEPGTGEAGSCETATAHMAPHLSTRFVRVSTRANSAPNDRCLSPVAGKTAEFVYRSNNLLWVVNPDSGALCCVWATDADWSGHLHSREEQLRILAEQHLGAASAELAKVNAKCAELLAEQRKVKPLPEGTGFVVWSPESSQAITKQYPSLLKAQEVAEIMANRHPGQRFLPCIVLPGYKFVKPVAGQLQRVSL